MNIAYHIVRGKPVMKYVSEKTFRIGDKITYWIKVNQQDFVTPEYLKKQFVCICS